MNLEDRNCNTTSRNVFSNEYIRIIYASHIISNVLQEEEIFFPIASTISRRLSTFLLSVYSKLNEDHQANSPTIYNIPLLRCSHVFPFGLNW